MRTDVGCNGCDAFVGNGAKEQFEVELVQLKEEGLCLEVYCHWK